MFSSVLDSILQLTGIVGLLMLIVIMIAIIISTIQAILDNIRRRKIKDETLIALDKMFDEMIEGLQKDKNNNVDKDNE